MNLTNAPMLVPAGVRMTYTVGRERVRGSVWAPGPKPGTVWVLRADGETFDLVRSARNGWEYVKTHSRPPSK